MNLLRMDYLDVQNFFEYFTFLYSLLRSLEGSRFFFSFYDFYPTVPLARARAFLSRLHHYSLLFFSSLFRIRVKDVIT